jgi:ATP-dependent HslUV protease ATP-binding subunit HslU
MTKYGPVKTDYMLFIAGELSMSQRSATSYRAAGQVPDKGGAGNAGKKEFELILTQPKNAITKQYEALLRRTV